LRAISRVRSPTVDSSFSFSHAARRVLLLGAQHVVQGARQHLHFVIAVVLARPAAWPHRAALPAALRWRG
jgi:hypothetical protein